jgi:molybdopterin converting factor small subunit
MARSPSNATQVRVELLPPLGELVGRVSNRRAKLSIDFVDGETVLDFLLRLGRLYPDLHSQLWDDERRELRQPIEIAVNGAVLGIHHQLESALHPRDDILLVPQYQGG